jgi:Holliday junction DNA helicase RuvA
MIGFLSGLVKSVGNHRAIVLVGGVGYVVNLPASLHLLPDQPIDLFIHTHVREDALTLFGFRDEASLDLFEKLISVSGIGPKSAQAIISVGSADVVKKAIESSNLNFFTTVPGIGKKSAQKIILELKSKFSQTGAELDELEGNPQLNQALTQLGFTKTEILSAISGVDSSLDLSAQIKQALKLLRS